MLTLVQVSSMKKRRVVWAFVHEEKLSYKKDADRQRAGLSRCGASAPAMDGLSGSHRPDPAVHAQAPFRQLADQPAQGEVALPAALQ
jgi:hypothetical protein